MPADRAMGEPAGGGQRIDLGAPLRSVRRADAPPEYGGGIPSGPVRHPGAVPFVWEQRPGQPKSVRTRRAPPREAPRTRQEEVGGSPYHDALGELEPLPFHGVAAYVSRASADSCMEEATAVVEANEEVKRQELVAPATPKQEVDGEEEHERFSDALDTLSRTESFTVNCSVSGLSGALEPVAGAEPGARGFMMDRFLPAAHAVAVGSPQYTFRKAGAAAGTGNSAREQARAAAAARNGDDRMRRAPVQLPFQHLPPSYLSCASPRHEEEEDDDYDVQSTRGFSSKGCGLLPGLCVKTSLLLLNPVPAMKRGKARQRDRQFPPKGRGQMAPSPLARSSQNKHLGFDSNGQSWEDVYKHKLEQKYLEKNQGEDGRSKLTSESNQLTFWSDSQTGDGSSPFHNSVAGGMSPYRSYAVMSPSSKANRPFVSGDQDDKASRSNGSGSLGRDHDHSSLVGSDRSSFKGSSSMSSGLDRTGHEESMDHCVDIVSETGHSILPLVANAPLIGNVHHSQPEGLRIVRRNSPVRDQVVPLIKNVPQTRESTFSEPCKSPGTMKLDDGKHLLDDADQEVPLHLEDDTVFTKEFRPMQSLLPLPVPKSPSESWLSRTLPSVTNNPPVPTFLGIQVQSKKQAIWASVQPKENGQKPSRPRQIRFADVVERPISVDSEI